MSEKKEIAIIIVLLVAIVSAIYGIVHVPPPEEYASKYEVLELKKEVAELREEIKRETDPARIQQRTLKYILEKEIDRHEK